MVDRPVLVEGNEPRGKIADRRHRG